jgi:hypothetical protein
MMSKHRFTHICKIAFVYSRCRLPVLRTITFGFSILLVKTNLTNGQCSQNCTQPWFQTSYQFCHNQTLCMKVGQDFSINFKFNKDHFITCFLLLLSWLHCPFVRFVFTSRFKILNPKVIVLNTGNLQRENSFLFKSCWD